VRAIKDHQRGVHFSNKNFLPFKYDDIIKVTDKEGANWSGIVVGDKKAFIGKFPPDFVGPVDARVKVESEEEKKKVRRWYH